MKKDLNIKKKKTGDDGMPQKRYAELNEEPPLSFKDRFAMWVSGMLIIGIPCLVLIIIILLVTFIVFGGFR